MLQRKLIPVAVATAVVLGGAGVALAYSGEHENDQELQAVMAAKVSLAEALAKAEQGTGGRAVAAGLEHRKSATSYEVKTVSKGKLVYVFVNPDTGAVMRTEKEGLIGRLGQVFDSEDRAEIAKLDAATTTLGAAIATAEKSVGGKAVDASYENENSKILYEVEVAKDNTVHKVKVDSASGKILSTAPSDDEREHHDDNNKHERDAD